jgi:hypothetical protein
MGLACLKGTGWWSGDPGCLWIPGLTGLGGVVQQTEILGMWIPCLAGLRGTGLWSGYCAHLCRPGGHSPAEWRSCMCVPQAWQDLGALLSTVKIMQACAGLGGVAQQ